MTPHDRLRTELCDLLGIELPILQAPMAGGWVTPDLVAEVGRSGGLGFIPAARASIASFGSSIEAVRARTGRPFGVNFLLAPPEPAPADVEQVQAVLDVLREELGLARGPRTLTPPPSVLGEQFELALAARVPCMSFAMGCPTSLIEGAREAGIKTLVMVTSVEEAVEAEVAGADVVIAQGIEAGGHRGTFRVGADRDLPDVGTFVLVPKVVDAVSVPVVAAGGVMDGRGLVAARALGAAGVQLGTRFLLARESGAYEAYRRLLMDGRETSTSVTRLFTGRPARGFKNRILEALAAHGVEPLPWPYQALAAEDLFADAVRHGRVDTMVLLAGQGLGGTRAVEAGAAEIVAELAAEAVALLVSLQAPGGVACGLPEG